jgi:hypothetical protein
MSDESGEVLVQADGHEEYVDEDADFVDTVKRIGSEQGLKTGAVKVEDEETGEVTEISPSDASEIDDFSTFASVKLVPDNRLG